MGFQQKDLVKVQHCARNGAASAQMSSTTTSTLLNAFEVSLLDYMMECLFTMIFHFYMTLLEIMVGEQNRIYQFLQKGTN